MPELVVTDAFQAAEGIFGFELRDPAGGDLPAFTAGAHVQVRSPHGLVRKYSLCNDPAERRRYLIAVKRDPAGSGGSVDLVDNASAGTRLEVSAPHNSFELSPRARSFLLIAGGIGITPILAKARALNADGRPYTLCYLTRSPQSTAFLDELSGPAFAGKVVIHHDGGDPQRSFDLWPLLEKPGAAHIHCCGPRPLLEGVRDMTGHWPAEAVHFESFADALAAARPDDRTFTVVLARSGAEIEVPPRVSILEAMRARGFAAPSSCESGTCGTCRTRLVEGEADHRDLVLMDEEKADTIMLCVSRARGARIVIDR
jgi:phthalate 4,5-dioxygenase reductase subunit